MKTLLFFILSSMVSVLHAEMLSYSGRLVNATGVPVTGTVNLKFDLVYSGSTTTIRCTKTAAVPLSNGVFHANLDFTTTECGGVKTLLEIIDEVPAGQSLTYQVTDLTNSKPYGFQPLSSVPLSLMAKMAKTITSHGATDGQVLTWNAATKKWLPSNSASGSGTLVSLTAGAGITVAPSGADSYSVAITNAGVGTTQLADSSVNSAKILDGSILGSDIADTTIPYAKLNIGAGDIPQDRINGLGTSLSGKEPAITAGSTAQYWRGDKSWQDLNTAVRAAVSGTAPLTYNSSTGAFGLGIVPIANGGTGLATSSSYSLVTTGMSGDYQFTRCSPGQIILFDVSGIPTCSTLSTTDNTKLPLAGGSMTGDINMANSRILGLPTPSDGQEAATKSYVDSAVSGTGVWTANSGNVYRSTGFVGIGTTTPDSTLDVVGNARFKSGYETEGLRVDSGSAGYGLFRVNSSNGQPGRIQFADGQSGWAWDTSIVRPSAGVLRVEVDGTTPANFDVTGNTYLASRSGNVGIGTTSPSTKLYVSSNGSSDAIRMDSDQASVGLVFSSTGNSSRIRGTTAGNSELQFLTNGSERLRIAATGNVGVGTTTPTGKLDVRGSIVSTNASSQFFGFQAPASGTSNIWTLPATTGTSGQVLTTNGSGILSWTNASAGGITALTGDVSASGSGSVAATISNSAVTSAKILDGTITGADIADATIPYAKLNLTDGVIPSVKVNGLDSALSAKEPAITAGSATQYWRGDKSWQTLDTSAVPEATNLYFTEPRVRSTVLSGYSTGIAIPIAATDTFLEAIGKLEAYVNSFSTSGQWSTSGGNVYRSSGNVGIGTSTPSSALEVAGLVRVTNNNIFLNSSQTLGWSGSGTGITGDGAANSVTIKTAGSPKLSVLSDGSVGIGTTTPAATLDVRNTTGNLLFVGGGANQVNVLATQQAMTINRTGTNSSTVLSVDSNDTTAGRGVLRVTSAGGTRELIWADAGGNVGIGKTAPNAKLDVNGAIAMSGATSGFTGFQAPVTNTGNTIWTLPSADGTSGQVLSTNGSGVLDWTTPSAGSSVWTESGGNVSRSSGRVGIGTASPSSLLEVSGGTSSGILTLRGNTGGASLTSAYTELIGNGNAIKAQVGLSSNVAGVGPGYSMTDALPNSLMLNSNSPVQIATSSAVRLTVANSGNVGIGKTSPSAKLDVNGPIVMSGSSSGYTGFQAPATNTGNTIWTLPVADGTSGQVLSTSGAGVLSWITPSASSVWSMNGANTYFSGGNVGIGTSTPSYPLEVTGNVFFGSGGNGSIFLGSGTSALTKSGNAFGVGGTLANNYLVLRTDGGEKVRIDASGKMGVGTTTPNGLLDVKGDFVMSGATSGYAGFRVPAVAGSTVWTLPSADGVSGDVLKTNGAGVLSWSAAGGGGDFFKDGSVAMTGDLFVSRYIKGGNTGNVLDTGASAGNPFYIRTSDADIHLRTINNNAILFTTNANERMRLNQSGNLGIGTSTPTHRLSVYNGTAPATSNVESASAGSAAYQRFAGLTAGSSAQSFLTGLNISSGNGSYEVYDQTAGASRLAITTAGNVGMGTVAPNGRLDVKGSIVMSGLVSGYSGFQSAATAGSTVWTLPMTDGTSGQVLSTNGSGALSWVTSTGADNFGNHIATQTLQLGSNLINNNGGSNGMTFDTAGRATITTTSGGPSAQLTLTNTSPASGSGSEITFRSQSVQTAGITTFLQGSPSDSDLIFSTRGSNSLSEKMRIKANGYLGLGTSNPVFPFEVKNGFGSYGAFIGSSPTSGGIGLGGSTLGGLLHSFTSGGGDADLFIQSNGARKVMIGAQGAPLSKVDVNGNMAIGSYAGSNAAPSNGLIVSGNTGIGTSNPNHKLDVQESNSDTHINIQNNSSTSARFPGVLVQNYSGGFGGSPTFTGIQFRGNIGSPAPVQSGDSLFMLSGLGGTNTSYGSATGALIQMQAAETFSPTAAGTNVSISTSALGSTSLQNRLMILSGGNVGIGTTSPSEKLEVTGNVKATAFISTSDKRLKKNIKVVKGLPAILQLRGVTYEWREDGSMDMGVIAQETEKVFPWAVVTNKVSGYKAVKYNALIGPMIEAIKDLDKKDKEILRKIASIEEENKELREKNQSLENMIIDLAKRLEKLEAAKK